MSGLTERVRDKVRGRSRSRKPTAQNPASTSSELQKSTHANGNDSTDPSSSITAWHIHKGNTRAPADTTPQRPHVEPSHSGPKTSVRMNYSAIPTREDEYTLPISVDNDDSPLMSADEYAAARYTNTTSNLLPSYTPRKSAESDKIPVSQSSLPRDISGAPRTQSPVGERGVLDANRLSGIAYPYTVPRRKESLPQNREHRRQKSSVERKLQQRASDTLPEAILPSERPAPKTSLPHQMMGGDFGTEVDEALASLSVNDARRPHPSDNIPVQGGSSRHERTLEPPQEQSDEHTSGQSEHLRLPAEFNLGHRETTTIDTQWRPAVTHENIHHDRTEVIQEAITRDIHIHHYYTYVQPIKVVEVLPAKHYRLDEATGRKVEIPAPAGWVMPSDLQPRTGDTSTLKGYTRHYLVNEQYPYGIAEQPPQGQENFGGGRSRVKKYSTRVA